MNLSQRLITRLRELRERGEISSARLQEAALVSTLKEEGIIKVSAVGKTRTKIILQDADALLQYLKIEYAITLDDPWESLVEKASLTKMLKEVLLRRPIIIKGMDDKSVIAQLERKSATLEEGMSKRQISATLFWGLSKVLDDRPEIVRAFNGIESPVMLNVCGMSSDPKVVLFIENYDTYVRSIESETLREYVIIYSAGFGSSALRIRDREGCSIHYARDDRMDEKNRERFEKWLWRSSEEVIPVTFFGDLDYSGVEIFKALRRSFNTITFYRLAYDAMLDAIRNGEGHAPEMADKEGQKDPGHIGDPYCDEILLPAMREHGFYDQEGVS